METFYRNMSISSKQSSHSIDSIQNSTVSRGEERSSALESNDVIGLFEYEEYISLKTINDPNEGSVT